MHEPPAASVCPPARLFRILTSGQPRWPLSYQPPGLERFALEARGLSSCESARHFDEMDRLTREKRAVVSTLDLIAMALLADGRQAFTSADQVGALPSRVVDSLGLAVLRALAVCSPLYRATNDAAWERVLRAGAAENWRVALALGGCVDEGPTRLAERPDRYWGRPLIEITDGQWMAYRASRWFLRQLTEKASAPPIPRPRR